MKRNTADKTISTMAWRFCVAIQEKNCHQILKSNKHSTKMAMDHNLIWNIGGPNSPLEAKIKLKCDKNCDRLKKL